MQHSRWLLAFAAALGIVVALAFQLGPHAEAAEAQGSAEPKGSSEPLVTVTFGSTEVGGTVYPPHQLIEGNSGVGINTDWLFAGVVRDESRYAYVATSNPTNPEAPSEIVPFDYWSPFGVDPAPAKQTSTRRQYGTGINHPDADVAYFASRHQLVIDEVQLNPNVATLQVTNSFDAAFSWETSPGGFESSAYDQERRVAYFGRNSQRAEMALVLMGPTDGTLLDRVMVREDAEKIVSIAIGDPTNYMFALVDNPAGIVTLTRATPPQNPIIVAWRPIAGDMSGAPISISADGANGHLYVYSAPPHADSQQIGKYKINPDTGTLEFLGLLQLPAAPGGVMLHDKKNGWLYVVGRLASSMNIYRLNSGVGDQLPFVEVETLDRRVLSATRSRPISWGFLTGDNGWAYLTSYSDRLNSASGMYRVRVDGNRVVAGSYHGKSYAFLNQRLDSNGVLRSINLYTHGEGKVRFAIYRAFSATGGIPFGSRIWESPEVDAVPGGWVSVPILTPDLEPFVVDRSVGLTFFFQISSEDVKPAFLGRNQPGVGIRIYRPYSPFIDNLSSNPFPHRVSDNYSFYLDVDTQPALFGFNVRPLGPGADPEWTNSRDVILNYTGYASSEQTVDVSTTPSFDSFQSLVYNQQVPYTMPADSALEGATITLYTRLRNGDFLGHTLSDTIQFDSIAPPTPGVPGILGLAAGNERVRYNLPSPPGDPAPGSGTVGLDVAIGTAPGLDDLQRSFVTGGGLFLSDPVPAGSTVYARVRARDKAGNNSAWSDSSEGIFINSLPQVQNLAISPADPRTTDEVTASFDLFDGDGDVIDLVEYRWSLTDVMSTDETLDPALTTRGQQWTLFVRARDSRGEFGPAATVEFEIVNSLPTQPIVKLVPETPSPDEDLIVDVQVYSTDADGDEIGYDFRWFKSDDNGATFVEKLELRGSPQVSKNFISAGEVWEVNYVPFEVTSTRGTARVEGAPGRDRVYVGENRLPEFHVEQPVGSKVQTRDEATTINLAVYWTFSEPDGEACTVDIYWTDLAESGLVPIAEGLDAELRRFRGNVEIPNNRPIHIHAIIADEKGAIVQRITPPILIGEVGTGVVTY